MALNELNYLKKGQKLYEKFAEAMDNYYPRNLEHEFQRKRQEILKKPASEIFSNIYKEIYGADYKGTTLFAAALHKYAKTRPAESKPKMPKLWSVFNKLINSKNAILGLVSGNSSDFPHRGNH